MTKVFIGGSRAVSRLSNIIRAQLDDLIHKHCTILIGDANGADKAVQQHFADRNFTDFYKTFSKLISLDRSRRR
jgi:hypothetical protein